MGYTHYWRGLSRVNPETYQGALQDIRKIIAASSSLVAQQPDNDADGYNEPADLAESSDILINGRGGLENNHETFWLPVDPLKTRAAPDGPMADHRDFQFCKTAEKPYDIVIVASLATLAQFCPEVECTSNGNPDDWREGCELASKILGREVPVPETVKI